MSWLSEPSIPREVPTFTISAGKDEVQGPFYTPPPVPVGNGWRATKQLRIGIAIAVTGLAALSFGTHNFIGRISIVGKIAGWSTLLPRWPIAVLMVGGGLFVTGLIFLIMAIINSRDKMWPVVALTLALLMSGVLAVASIGTGQVALQKHTLAEIRLVMDQLDASQVSISPEQVEWGSKQLERLGITLPEGQDLGDLLPSGVQ